MLTKRRRQFRRYTLIALTFLTLGLAALPALAERPPLIPRETLFGNPEKTQATDVA